MLGNDELHDEDGIPEVKFHRSAVQEILKVGEDESIVITVQVQSNWNNNP